MAIPVWQMVKEAVNSLGGTATYKQIRDYINSHYGDVHRGTILAQTIACTVNQPSRVYYPQNKKPRNANGKYDFLFSIKKGKVTLYDHKVHGNYRISIRDGKLMIAKDTELENSKIKEQRSKKETYFIFRTKNGDKYGDREGIQYGYNGNTPNYTKVREGANVILQRRDGDEHFFIGHGKVANVKDKPKSGDQHVKEYIAEFDNYQAFEPPKLRTAEIYQMMQSSPGFNNQHAISQISGRLYDMIMETAYEAPAEIKNHADILRKKYQLILYGPPGTGKTYNAMRLAEYFVRANSPRSITFKSAAIQILKKARKPMHYKEISSKIFDQGLVQTSGKTPEYTILKAMSGDIQLNGASSIFRKTGSGTYGLNPKAHDHKTKIWNRSPSENENEFIRSVTFHQSYSYEDFVEGIRPTSTGGQILYSLEDGIFKQIAEEAENDPSNKYVLLIDEVNRGNISKIFGELITLIEKDKRVSHPLQLAYSKERFIVPENLFIVGTMNTADRSLIQIDAALRRRFAFVEIMPKPDLLENTIQGVSLRDLLSELNRRIAKEGLREKQIGHSYFMGVFTPKDLQFVFAHEVVPLLQDYFFDDYKKLEEDILGSDFVDSENMLIKPEWQENTQRFMESLKNSFQP